MCNDESSMITAMVKVLLIGLRALSVGLCCVLKQRTFSAWLGSLSYRKMSSKCGYEGPM